MRADFFRSCDGLAMDKMVRIAREAGAQVIITAAPELWDSDGDTIRFGYENVTVWKESGNARNIIKGFDVECWWSHG
jgi:hypothetical protein